MRSISPAPVAVPISELRLGDTPRAGDVDPQHVRKLAAAADLPPILVHRPTMRVVDGVHRLRAAILLGRTEVEVRFFDGTAEEAFVAAVRANIRHGLLLSRKERSAAARRIMISQPTWSDRAVAAATGLSVRTVAEIRRATDDIPRLNTRVGLDGRVRPVNGADGRRRAAAFIRTHPRASLREIASAAGVSAGTARDVRHRLDRDEDPVPSGLRVVPSGPAGSRRLGAGERADALAALLKDPALRSTDPGRLLLRLLDNRVLAAPRLAPIAAAVPPHSRSAVSAAVRQCIETWREFARDLEEEDCRSIPATMAR